MAALNQRFRVTAVLCRCGEFLRRVFNYHAIRAAILGVRALAFPV